MENMSLNSNEGIKARIMNGKPNIGSTQSRPLKDEAKQKLFLELAKFHSRIGEAIKML